MPKAEAKPARREQSRTTEKKRLIEGVAAELFALRGYDGTSLRDIAEQAHVQLGSLFYLYREKQVIYDSVVSAAIEYFGERILKAVGASALAEKQVCNLVEVMVHEHARDSVFGHILARELAAGKNSRLAILGRRVFRQLREALNPAVRRLRKGPMSDAQADRLTGQLINMIYAATRAQSIYAVTFGVPEPKPAQLVVELQDLIFNGLLKRR